MISIFQLQQLPLAERTKYILTHGKLMNGKTEGHISSNIYNLGTFHAEIDHNNDTDHVVQIILMQQSFIK
jgi:hypothetical protein